MTKVFLKFGERTMPAARARTTRLLKRAGAVRVRRLFPRTTDASLKRHYVAEFASATAARRAIRELRGDPSLGSAHLGAIRRLPGFDPVP